MKQGTKTLFFGVLTIVLSVFAAYVISVVGGRYMQTHFGRSDNCEITSESEPIDGDVVLQQTIAVPYARLTQIGISIANLYPEQKTENAACLVVSVSEEEETLCSWTTDALCNLEYQEDSFGKLKPQAYCSFEIPENILVDEGEYTIAIRGVNMDGNSQIAVGVNEDTIYVHTEGELPQHPGERFFFTLLYMIVFALILMRMFLYKDISQAFEQKRLDKIIVFYTLFLFTFTFTYYEDTVLIYENARVMKSAIKHGQFFHFYDYVMIHSRYRLSANYNVIMYLLFAVCLLPYDIACALFGEIPLYYGQLWYNLIVTVVYVITGYRVRALLKVWNIDAKKSDLVTVLFFTNPLLLYGTVGFSQLDIFYIALFVEGLLLFEKKKTDKACLLWSLAVAMKALPILVIVPLLLLREKRLLQLLRYLIETMSLLILSQFIYGGSEGWILNQQHNPHFERLFNNMLPVQRGSASIFLIVYFLILFYCWTTKRKEDYQATILCGVTVFMAFFCFCDWYAQYVTLAGLFLVWAVLLVEDARIYLGIEAFLSLGFILAEWIRSGDGANLMILNGCVGGLQYVHETPLLFSEFVHGITDLAYPMELAQSISVAAAVFLTGYCIYCVKYRKKEKWDCPSGYLYLPMLPVYAILLLSGIITFST